MRNFRQFHGSEEYKKQDGYYSFPPAQHTHFSSNLIPFSSIFIEFCALFITALESHFTNIWCLKCFSIGMRKHRNWMFGWNQYLLSSIWDDRMDNERYRYYFFYIIFIVCIIRIFRIEGWRENCIIHKRLQQVRLYFFCWVHYDPGKIFVLKNFWKKCTV